MRISSHSSFDCLRSACWLIGVLIASGVTPAWSQSSTEKNVLDPNRQQESFYDEYERRLNAILKTRRDDEKKFVEELVDKLEQDKIPVKLIDTSFEWVRNKRPDTDYPFYYFERVLRLQAAKLDLGSEIPDFDYSDVQVSGVRAPGQQFNAGNPTERQRKSLLNRFFRFPGWFQSDSP